MRKLIMMMAVLGGAPTSATELQSALSANVEITSIADSSIDRVEANVPFRIRVTLNNLAGPDAPAGLFLSGWLRPRTPNAPECVETARAFLATNRIPTDSIDLNGAIVLVLTEDAGMTLVDPDLNLASANLIGANTFEEQPVGVIADPDGKRFLFALPNAGEIAEISVYGGDKKTLLEGLVEPKAVYPAKDGAFWVLEHEELIYSDGEDFARYDASHAHFDPNSAFLSAWGGESIMVFDENARLLWQTSMAGDILDVLPISEDGRLASVLVLKDREIELYYVDTSEAAAVIPLDYSHQRLAVDNRGRWVFAWGEDTPIEIIDNAVQRVAQKIGASGAISEIRFGDDSAYLMMADHSKVGAIDLTSMSRDAPVQIREIALGEADRARDGETLLFPLPGQAEFMAIHPGSYTGFFIHDYSVMGDAPPMSAVRLRGGIPLSAAAIDRGFTEKETGVFETVAQIPREIPYELVATTGIGGISFCAPLPSDYQLMAADSFGHVEFSVDELGQVKISLQNTEGEPLPTEGVFMFKSLITGWRRAVRFETDEDGMSKQSYVLPDIGPISLIVEAEAKTEFQPAIYGDTK